jgi:hypothetical protein
MPPWTPRLTRCSVTRTRRPFDAEAKQPVAKSPAQVRQQTANKRQQKDELEEEGLVSVNEPDGVEPGTETEDSADD